VVCYLYKIINKVNGKVYIGLTSNPTIRKSEHFSCKKPKSLVAKAIKKYGKENFSFEILCKGSRKYISELEIKAILLYKSSVPFGYNIRPGGDEGGSGYLIQTRSDDKAVYASGFWFPNTRTAVKSLSINTKTFYERQSLGRLGECEIFRKDAVKDIAQYVGGFWFPNLLQASKSLNVSLESLKMRLFRGSTEAETRRSSVKLSENNPMFGVKGKDHPRARAVLIQGEYFDSISDAVRQTNFTKSQIEKRLKKKVEGFEYFDPS